MIISDWMSLKVNSPLFLFLKFYFKQSVEETVNLRYVTFGRLKKSGTSFNPEMGQIKLSLQLDDPAWKPRQGLDKWDERSRTFTEVSPSRNLHNLQLFKHYLYVTVISCLSISLVPVDWFTSNKSCVGTGNGQCKRPLALHIAHSHPQ